MGRKLCTITFEEIETLTAEDYEQKQLHFSDLKTKVVCKFSLTKYGREIGFDVVKELKARGIISEQQ